MRTKTMDFIVDEDEFIAYQIIQLVYGKYSHSMPKKAVEHIQKAMRYIIEDLEEGYPALDITDNKVIERVTFNLDTYKNLRPNKENK